MAETLKKYRVKTVDGKVKFIEAKNIHDAQSIARIEIGQLPNEVNLKILEKVLAELQEFIFDTKSDIVKLKSDGKNLDWNSVNQKIKDISKHMTSESTRFNQLAGSMVRIDNKEN